MRRPIFAATFLLGWCWLGEPKPAHAHDLGSTALTWNRDISRIVFDRCASCHREGGTAFSLMTYQEAQPKANAILDQVLSRKMPPWGAVKGFGDFRNDQGLTQEQLELFSDWINGGLTKGNNPNVLPKEPKFDKQRIFKVPKNAVTISGDFTLSRELILDGLFPEKVPDGSRIQMIATLPDGDIEPLVWFYEYKESYQHPFLFRKPLRLPAGTVIRGVPPEAKIILIPGTAPKGSK